MLLKGAQCSTADHRLTSLSDGASPDTEHSSLHPPGVYTHTFNRWVVLAETFTSVVSRSLHRSVFMVGLTTA